MALLSYAHGGGDTPLLGVTVGQLLDTAARRWPDNDALIVVDQGVRWNWRELRERAKHFAAGLITLGLQPGDRVGMLAPNRAEWLIAQFGTAYAGLILVNINPAYRTPELEYALKKVGCRALITESAFKTSDYVAMLNELAPELADSEPGNLRSAGLAELRIVIRLGDERSPGMFNYGDVAPRNRPEDVRALETIGPALDFDSPINIQFTSGTTGSPKAATLTHHNIVNNASLSASIMKFTERDRLCMPVPMYHCFGMVLGTLLCASSGSAIVLPSAGFEAGACLRAIEKERCTAVHGVPTMFIAMLDEPGFAERDTTSLRTGIMAGAPCPIELMHRVIDEMHLGEITIGYGMTETGPLSTQTLPDDPIELRVGTVGRPYRRRGAHRAARRARRTLHPRLQRHARLLGRPGAYGQRHRRSTMDPQR
jgi:fatty-acyl-CoA synthase